MPIVSYPPYDPLTRAPVTTSLAGSAWSSAVTRAWNNRGLLASESFAIGASNTQRTYGYTPQGFVAQSTDADASYSYAYDPTGLPSNITSTIDGVIDARAFGSAGNVLTAGTHSHTFDGLGRVIQRDDVAITYGPNGQIAGATNATASWTYLYDEKGQRIAKLEGGEPVAAYLPDGSYLDINARTAPITFAGQIVGVLVEPTSGGSKVFQLTTTDARGSVLADADATQHLPSPFGDRAVHPDVAAAIDYATKSWDADLGAVRMGVRDYDPSLSRFLQPDPLYLEEVAKAATSPVEANLYSYAKDNPLLYRDLSGQCVDGCVGEGAAVAIFAGLVFTYATLNTYVQQPSTQKNFAAAITAGEDAAEEAWNGGKERMQDALQKVAQTAVATYAAAKADALVARLGKDTGYVFVTYKVELTDGSVYSGRTAGIVNPGESYQDAARNAVKERWDGHHMFEEAAPEKGGPVVDAYAGGKLSAKPTLDELGKLAENYMAIRGREQQNIDKNGGARSEEGGTSGNAIRGVAKENPIGPYFYGFANTLMDEFGAPTRGVGGAASAGGGEAAQ